MSAVHLAFKLMKKHKPAIKKNEEVVKKGVEEDEANNKNRNSSKFEAVENGYSETSIESGTGASSLVVLSSPEVNGLKFKDLLRAPKELVRGGKHGSLFKVTLEGGVNVALKRVKDWGISREDFNKRMERVGQVKHPNVLPPLAYYCTEQERLVVYEFQQNGSLFGLLHGNDFVLSSFNPFFFTEIVSTFKTLLVTCRMPKISIWINL